MTQTRKQQTENMNIRIESLVTIDPITPKQQEAWEAYREGNHLALIGTAGTGKTFLALYLALEEVMNKSTPYETVHIVRSVVPTREVGYLPGTLEDKLDAFTGPYRAACTELFNNDTRAWEKLVHNNYITFGSTSYIRGVTFNSSIVIVDECQNLNFHELDSVITRVGQATKVILCGDYHQTDFKQEKDKEGIHKFIEILDNMRHFSIINFGWEDIVRSDFVRDYIMTKEWMGIK